jgi:transposase
MEETMRFVFLQGESKLQEEGFAYQKGECTNQKGGKTS